MRVKAWPRFSLSNSFLMYTIPQVPGNSIDDFLKSEEEINEMMETAEMMPGIDPQGRCQHVYSYIEFVCVWKYEMSWIYSVSVCVCSQLLFSLCWFKFNHFYDILAQALLYSTQVTCTRSGDWSVFGEHFIVTNKSNISI